MPREARHSRDAPQVTELLAAAAKFPTRFDTTAQNRARAPLSQLAASACLPDYIVLTDYTTLSILVRAGVLSPLCHYCLCRRRRPTSRPPPPPGYIHNTSPLPSWLPLNPPPPAT